MATAYSNYHVGSDGQIRYRVRMDYGVTSNPATTATVGVVQTSMQQSTDLGQTYTDISSQASSQVITIGGTQTSSKTISKTHSTQTIAVTGAWQFQGDDYSISVSVSVDAKTHYTVTYNANSGANPPSPTTKWYGETMIIPTAQPTKTGYTFKGWATSATGSAVYASGGSYTTNAGAILYAVWEAYHYDVTYNANSGTGAPQKQVKDYGTDLRLTTATPALEGYTFLGWATSTAIASTGQVEYQKGGLYQTNAPITLYAVWELAYQAPTITEVSIERCQQNGSLDDDGEYASVGFEWSIFKSALPQYVGGNTYPYANNAVSNCTITVGTQTITPTLTTSPASEVVGSGTYDTDVAYATTISITDNVNVTTTYSGTLALATFPLDYNADASAVGFFRPAPDNGSGAYFAKDINADSDINIKVDTNAGSGVDYDITTALADLNWTDVYV